MHTQVPGVSEGARGGTGGGSWHFRREQCYMTCVEHGLNCLFKLLAVSTSESTVFILMMSYIGKAGFGVAAGMKSKYPMDINEEQEMRVVVPGFEKLCGAQWVYASNK